MISTRDLSLLPDIPSLKRLCQSLAMLDAILEPEWVHRYYSFDAHWSEGEELASMRTGEGDGYVLLFGSAGAILKGFAHESPMSLYQHTPPRVWPGVLDDVPQVFSSFLAEPAFEAEATTFCLWRTLTDNTWQRGTIQFSEGDDPDGSADLLALLDGNPKTYQQWAKDYYERPINLAAVTHIYEHHPLSPEIVAALNTELSLADLQEDIETTAY